MTDLITWLRTQLDTDEQVALAALGAWIPLGPHPDDPRPIARLMARNAPDGVLRQVQANRAILDDYARAMERRKQHPDDLASAGALLALHGVVKRVASIYSDRDGYREEWRP